MNDQIHTKRIVRSRRKGWRMPENSLYVGRPTMWGNPFQVARFGHMKAVLIHREWLAINLGALFLERQGYNSAEIEALDRARQRVLTSLHRLQGLNLACWCHQSLPRRRAGTPRALARRI